MGKGAVIGDLDDRYSLAELLRWMNEQRRAPVEKAFVWRHRAARKQLEFLGLRFLQPTGPRGKLYFFGKDLRRFAPKVAAEFLGHPAEPEAAPAQA